MKEVNVYFEDDVLLVKDYGVKMRILIEGTTSMSDCFVLHNISYPTWEKIMKILKEEHTLK